MKRLVPLGSLILLTLVLTLELSIRGGGRTTLLEPADLFAPAQRGWCGGAWCETDEHGQRRDASAWLAQPRGRTLVVVGGPFTAGAGLEDAELYAVQLEKRARGASFDRVVAFAAREGKPALVRRVLAALPRNGAIVIEVDGSDLGGDPAPFAIAGPARWLAPVRGSGSAAITWMRLLESRRERKLFESEIAGLVARDGFTGRATARAALRLEALTRADREQRLDPEQTRLLRAWIEEFHGLRRADDRAVRLGEWHDLFAEIQRDQRVAVLLVIGPTVTTLALVSAARGAAIPVVHAPPFELDSDLRVDVPWPRAAAAVHAQIADSLWVELSRRGLCTGASAAPQGAIDAAAAIEQQVLSRGGTDEVTLALARAAIGREVTFTRGPPPLNALHGVGADGLVEAETPAELVLSLPVHPTALIVRATAPRGAAPRLALRHAVIGAAADPTVVGPAPGAPSRDLVEWRFKPPPHRAPIDRPALEFTLLPQPDGSPPAAIELREVRFDESSESPDETGTPPEDR